MNDEMLKMVELATKKPMPMDDFEAEDELVKKWIETLGVDDALTLLSWVEKPVVHSEMRADYIYALRIESSRIAGIIGRRRERDAIREQLAKMLSNPETRCFALEALDEFEDPRSAELLRPYGHETNHQNVYRLTAILSRIANPEAIALLEEMRGQRHPGKFIEGCIVDSLNEARAKQHNMCRAKL